MDTPNVVVLIYGERQILLLKPRTYDELQRAVQMKFNLREKDLLFTTSSLDVCLGEEAELDEDVWDAIAPFLSRITAYQSLRAIEESSVARRHSQIIDPPPTPPFSDRSFSHVKEKQDQKDHIAEPPAEDTEDEKETVQENHDLTQPVHTGSESTASNEESDDDADTHAPQRYDAKDKTPVKIEPASMKRGIKIEPGLTDDDDALQRPKNSSKDKKFRIYVSCPAIDEPLTLLTRGNHLIEKVVGGACQALELDSSRVHLSLIVELEEDGHKVEYKSLCDKEDTVNKCGIVEGSRLIIDIDE